MKKIYLTLAAAGSVLACVSAGAQNLNPTVSVTKAYEGSLMEVHKPAQEMFVPDSLKRFDLDFDYSVFENPYKGSYDFSPYLLEMNRRRLRLPDGSSISRQEPDIVSDRRSTSSGSH